jgi:homospermidine synthase
MPSVSSFAGALDASNSVPLEVLIIGFGVVGKGVLVGLQKHFNNVNATVLDCSDTVIEDAKNSIVHQFINPNNHWSFKTEHLTSANYVQLLEELTSAGGIVVETCVEVNTADVLSWCVKHGRHFTNTVCDMWREETMEKTNHYKNIHGILRDFVLPVAKVIRDDNIAEGTNNTTCMVGNGANIGMVNHYFKKAMSDAAAAWGMTIEEVGPLLKGVYVFEKDTIVFRQDFVPVSGIFYNTWNVLEFHLESVAHVDYPPETGEGHVAAKGVQDVSYDRAVVRDLNLRDCLVHARVVSHEETYSIADWCNRQWGCHPEIQFLYECSPIGEVCRVKYPLGSACTPVCVSTEADGACGSDLVGTLIQLKDGRAWSTSFDCAQTDLAPELKKFTNATAWYVSCGVLSSILFLREFPNEGPGFPEDFDSRFNEIVVRNFENFVANNTKAVKSHEESCMRLTAAYPTYECENEY